MKEKKKKSSRCESHVGRKMNNKIPGPAQERHRQSPGHQAVKRTASEAVYFSSC